MGFKEGRIVDDGGQQGREGPQQERREKLSDYRVLFEDKERERFCIFKECSQYFPLAVMLMLSIRKSYVQVLHRLGDIEFVHGGDDDGRGGEEEEEEEEDAVDDEAAEPPGNSS